MKQQIAKKPQTIAEMLTVNSKQLSMALPKHITPDKMIRVALSEIHRSENLQKCTDISLFKCIVMSAQLGLFPDSLTGEAYLVPFTNNKVTFIDKDGRKKPIKEAQLIIGYQGLLKLAYQSNQITNITAKEVWENDKFSYQYGLKPDLVHVPAQGDRGKKVIYYYAVATLMNGGHAFEVMSRQEVEDHMKKYSRAASSHSSPWHTQFNEMAKKTLIRKIVKLLPRSTENLMRAVKIDEHADLGTQSELNLIDCSDFQVVDDEEPKQSKADKVANELINAEFEEVPEPQPVSEENKDFVEELGEVE